MNIQAPTTLENLVARGRCERNVPLGRMTTYKIGGNARYFCEPRTTDELGQVVEAAIEADAPFLILGRGSNLVVSDRGYPGVVIRPTGAFTQLVIEHDGMITAGAAVPLPRLARETVDAGRGGLEWCVGIPGSVGGAVRMNAGGHGSDTATWLIDAEILDGTGTTTLRTPADLDLSYRHSNLTSGEIVLSARFRTVAQEADTGRQHLREITQWRKEHQPGGTLNAGSVFKNPPGDSAGRLIDSVGLKGFRSGGIAVSERHANFFVAGDGASAQDVYDLVAHVRQKVGEAAGVWLEPEIRFAGEFDQSSPAEGAEEGRPG